MKEIWAPGGMDQHRQEEVLGEARCQGATMGIVHSFPCGYNWVLDGLTCGYFLC